MSDQPLKAPAWAYSTSPGGKDGEDDLSSSDSSRLSRCIDTDSFTHSSGNTSIVSSSTRRRFIKHPQTTTPPSPPLTPENTPDVICRYSVMMTENSTLHEVISEFIERWDITLPFFQIFDKFYSRKPLTIITSVLSTLVRLDIEFDGSNYVNGYDRSSYSPIPFKRMFDSSTVISGNDPTAFTYLSLDVKKQFSEQNDNKFIGHTRIGNNGDAYFIPVVNIPEGFMNHGRVSLIWDNKFKILITTNF